MLESSEDRLRNECPICFEEPRIADAVHTPCAHMFCKTCLVDEFREQQTRGKIGNQKPLGKSKIDGGDCPVCHTQLKLSQCIEVRKENGELISTYLNEVDCEKENLPNALVKRDEAARETLETALVKGATSSKLEAILKELDEIWKVDPGSKILIFSQYLGFLDIITRSLNRRSITSYRIDGKSSLKERVKMIEKFNKATQSEQDLDDDCQRGTVFLVSMKAGGCGLNLVAASTVFIIDPWW